jgi:hypothetical protein
MTAGCGGLTGITPLVRYRDWVTDTAHELGSPLPCGRKSSACYASALREP